MIGGGWPYMGRGRVFLLLLALVCVGVLLAQTRTPPVRLSAWPGPSGSAALGNVAPALPAQGQALTGRGLPSASGSAPATNPLRTANVVLTQGYGVGSHAPAAIWGGVDLAIDGNGDGQADPDATNGAPIYATISGAARVKPDTWPAGNYLSIEGDGYKVAYAHLSRYAVQDGQQVQRGQIVGYVGATGEASGPHLHYEVWKDGANVNPLDYGALDGVRR